MICPRCQSTDVYSSEKRHSCRACAFGWYSRFGTVTVGTESVSVHASGDELRDWARRPRDSWPCSTLEELQSITVYFDSGGLYDLDTEPTQYPVDADGEYLEGEGPDIDCSELNAWTSDVLRDVLPLDHPAYFVTVGQFEEAR